MSHTGTALIQKTYFELVTELGREMLENGGEIFRTGDVMRYTSPSLGLENFTDHQILSHALPPHYRRWKKCAQSNDPAAAFQIAARMPRRTHRPSNCRPKASISRA